MISPTWLIPLSLNIIFIYSLSEGVKVEGASTQHMTYFQNTCLAALCRGKWGKVSNLFSWLRGGETMKIELFFNLDCESLILCEQIRGKIKNR